jgi:V-type H+-transporting ATPase subunit D
VRRLELGRRAAEVLDEKRTSLVRERERVLARLEPAEAAWSAAAREAAAANARALALAGERRLRLAAGYVDGEATVELRWASAVGAVIPTDASVRVPPAADLAALGGGASVSLAHAAHARALEAAATYAAACRALAAVELALATTARRLRAVETRWIPRHEAALARLELALDEAERDEITRVRWTQSGRGGSAGAGS